MTRVLAHAGVAAASFLVLGSAHFAPRAVQAPSPPPASPRIAALPGADGGAPLFLTPPPGDSSSPAQVSTNGPALLANSSRTFGIPATVLDAYQRAESRTASSDPRCHMSWPLLAAIGQVESGQARGGDVDSSGRARQPILGPALNGTNGNGAMSNTFGTRYDQQGQWARAAGPMQFLPSTWTTWGADGNGDGVADPENVYDAALAASHYLCAGGGDLASPDGLRSAILSYNHSQQYLSTVLSWMRAYGQGGVSVPDQPDQAGAGQQVTQPASPPPSAASSPPAAPASSSRPSGGSQSSSSSGSSSGSSGSSSGSSGSGSGSSGSSSPPPSSSPAPKPSSPLPAPVNKVVGGVTGTVGGL